MDIIAQQQATETDSTRRQYTEQQLSDGIELSQLHNAETAEQFPALPGSEAPILPIPQPPQRPETALEPRQQPQRSR